MPVRLFLSSLAAGDLELAAREIANEQAARNQSACSPSNQLAPSLGKTGASKPA